MTTKLLLEFVPSSYFPFLHSRSVHSSSDRVKSSRLERLCPCGGLVTQMGLRGQLGPSRLDVP
ncbi:hypothetical protein I79_018664 [Cricetulus griseus]|uniref:Uncharacterized protein n=1 Tax=Cricetulus griseus TaxID=10029 RepID=G3I5C0_CRIGR|nr:hypothetical protein I79_018664 [Cricetulus griseus]